MYMDDVFQRVSYGDVLESSKGQVMLMCENCHFPLMIISVFLILHVGVQRVSVALVSIKFLHIDHTCNNTVEFVAS